MISTNQKEVKIYDLSGNLSSTAPLPKALQQSPNSHLIRSTFNIMNKNSRQPYAVSPLAGKLHSAEGWGTGRAVARVPRIKGSGTSRAGQGAFANFCRKGRLAHPTSINRKWYSKVTKKERNYALISGLSASTIPALVESRGHCINNLESIPLVVTDEIKGINKTKDALSFLKKIGLEQELDRIKESRTIRAGIGKMRNRKYRERKGVLLVSNDNLKAFRNIKGIEICTVEELDILKVCPGGSLGRLILWTEESLKKVDTLFDDFGSRMCGDEIEHLFYAPEVQALLEVKPYKGEMVSEKCPKEIFEMNRVNLGGAVIN